jgi:hypothetical protein
MAKPKRKKHQYQVMLTSIGVHSVTISGYSLEDACRILHRKIAGKEVKNTDVSTDSDEYTWSDPSNDGEAWIVAPVSQGKQTAAELMTWNGQAITKYDAKEMLWDLFQTSRKKRPE